jgi:hypothetical protein
MRSSRVISDRSHLPCHSVFLPERTVPCPICGVNQPHTPGGDRLLPEALLFDLPPLALDAAFRRAEREDRAEGKPPAQPQGLDRPTAG